MLNVPTIVQNYIQFCKESSLPTKPSPDGFVRLVTDSFFLSVFVAFTVKQGYSVEQWEDWEEDTFVKGSPESFFEDVQEAFEMLEEV